MKPSMVPLHYHSNEVLEAEKLHVFSSNWLFAGLRSSVANDRDFICVQTPAGSVVIQNFKGNLRAFKNVCPHRHARIQTEQEGNRPLQCPYHGWTFNQDGVPTVIPSKPTFTEFIGEIPPELRLKEWQLDSCGDLLFIREAGSGPELNTWLGDFHERLKQMSHGLHQQVDRNEFVVPANWKLWIENALEAYHARWVHPESFNPLVPREDHYNYAGSHSSMAGDMMVSPAHQKLTERLFGDRPYRCKGYEHYFVFPNMLLSTAQGASFNLMIVEPLGPKQSRVVSRVYLTQSSAPPTRTTTLLFKELGSASAEFSRQVLSEDLKIVSAVQAGIQESNYEGILSTLEERIHRFQQEWISCIGKSTSKDPVSPRRKQDRQVP